MSSSRDFDPMKANPLEFHECPDENVFAEFQAGLLHDRDGAFHRHLDSCAACFELMAVMGGSPSSPATRGSTESSQPDSFERPRWLLPCVSLLGVHVIAAVLLSQRIARALQGDESAVHGTWALRILWLHYSSWWSTLGLAAGALACVAALRPRSWSRFLGFTYALLSLPTFFLTPLAAFNLIWFGVLAHRKRRDPRRWVRRTAYRDDGVTKT